ncbi:glycerophosphodiester phosphodiesterase, partial [Lactobacillus parabuchneri]|nr:glycerophosphodiester phosphodiesterase [Lentilactobacillus parabuchneri]
MKLLTVLGMLLSVTLFTLLMAEVNRLVINRGVFLLSQGLIDVVSIGIELAVISRLLGIQFTRIHHGALVTSFGLALIIFAGLMTGLNPAYNAKPTAKPTIIVHRGVINHNAKG